MEQEVKDATSNEFGIPEDEQDEQVVDTEVEATGLGEKADDIPMDVTEKDFEASRIVQGWHRFRILEAWKGLSKKQQPKLTWKVICQDEPFVGQSLLLVCSLQRQALFTLEALFKAVAFKAVPGWTANQIYDMEFDGHVVHKRIDGELRVNIDKMRRVKL